MDVIGKGKSKGKGKYGGWAPQGKGIGFGNPGIGFNGTKGFQKGGYEFKGKGKGGPKGDAKGDGKGKGIGKGICFKCGHPGHIARDCPDPRPFQGHCTICGNWGIRPSFVRWDGSMK